MSESERVFEDPPEDALVVRGGEMRARDMDNSATAYWKTLGMQQNYALSVWSIPGRSAEEIAEAAGTEALPHPVLRKCTVGKLRAMGYTVEKSGREHHYSIRLPNPPGPQDWANLQEAFDPPQANPVRRG